MVFLPLIVFFSGSSALIEMVIKQMAVAAILAILAPQEVGL